MTGHERLADAMNTRRRELRLRWNEVARRAGMSPQNLLRIRKGQIAITWESCDGIDDALNWKRGSVEAILADGEPINLEPEPGPVLLDDFERQIWALSNLSRAKRMAVIEAHRERLRSSHQDQPGSGQSDSHQTTA